ncbi:MAG TPA: preprotein translocase subunit SecE [Gallionellaceae bacterium]|nr:preprotein translocase subunit SecE [Gallionellaceae bacterium]
MADKIKIVVALMLVAAGVVGFYYLQESLAVLRVLSVLAGLVLAGLVFWTSVLGKRFFAFSRESINEAKRVVWPTSKETYQTTGVVIIFAVVMALFLWAVDASLMLVVSKLN